MKDAILFAVFCVAELVVLLSGIYFIDRDTRKKDDGEWPL